MLFLLLAQAIISIEKKITQHKELIQWFSTRNGLPLPQDIFKCWEEFLCFPLREQYCSHQISTVYRTQLNYVAISHSVHWISKCYFSEFYKLRFSLSYGLKNTWLLFKNWNTGPHTGKSELLGTRFRWLHFFKSFFNVHSKSNWNHYSKNLPHIPA